MDCGIVAGQKCVKLSADGRQIGPTLRGEVDSGMEVVKGFGMAASASAALVPVDILPFKRRSVSGGSTMTFMGSTLCAMGLVGALDTPRASSESRLLRETNGPAWLVTLSEGCRAGTDGMACIVQVMSHAR